MMASTANGVPGSSSNTNSTSDYGDDIGMGMGDVSGMLPTAALPMGQNQLMAHGFHGSYSNYTPATPSSLCSSSSGEQMNRALIMMNPMGVGQMPMGVGQVPMQFIPTDMMANGLMTQQFNSFPQQYSSAPLYPQQNFVYNPQQTVDQSPQMGMAPVMAIGNPPVVPEMTLMGQPMFRVPTTGVLNPEAIQRAMEFTSALMNQQPQLPKVDTSKHFHVFVGDLSKEVDEKMLQEAFERFGEISEVKVMRDPASKKPRGYGFVSFPSKEDAERAIEGMDKQFVGLRAVRTGWGRSHNTAVSSSDEEKSTTSSTPNFQQTKTLEEIMNMNDSNNTTVYIGNMGDVTEESIRSAFEPFGEIKEVRLFHSQNYGFVVFEEKESAATAIWKMCGKVVEEKGSNIKCAWGKLATHNGNHSRIHPQQYNPLHQHGQAISMVQRAEMARSALIANTQQIIAMANAHQTAPAANFPADFTAMAMQQNYPMMLYLQAHQLQQQQRANFTYNNNFQ